MSDHKGAMLLRISAAGDQRWQQRPARSFRTDGAVIKVEITGCYLASGSLGDSLCGAGFLR